jgi:hypothetical protein
MKILASFFLLSLGVAGCQSNGRTVRVETEKPKEIAPQLKASRPVLIYKTKADYDPLVPVTLSGDKSQIVSYPHPADVKTGGEFPLPTRLNNGYLLDNRGVGKNVAFLKLSYEEYSNLKAVPSLKDLYDLIIDKEPLVELWDCGAVGAGGEVAVKINEIIGQGKLQTVCSSEM